MLDLSYIQQRIEHLKKYQHLALQPIPEQDILQFENRWHIRLPEEFRSFLVEIDGHDFVKSPIEEVAGLETVRKLPSDFLSAPFPFDTIIQDRKDCWRHMVRGLRVSKSVLEFAESGCGIWYGLVVSGVEYGHVWTIGHGNAAELFPCPSYRVNYELMPSPERWTFFQWLDDLLDNCMAQYESEYADKIRAKAYHIIT